MLGHHHKAVEISQSTEYAKEMRKWEAKHTRFGDPGRPYVFTEFPKMVYKAKESGDTFDTHVVSSAQEQANLLSRGYAVTQEAALEARRKQQTEHGTLAAEREWQIQHGRVGEKATEEVRQAEAEHGARHLPDVPEKPIRKRRTKAEMAEARKQFVG